MAVRAPPNQCGGRFLGNSRCRFSCGDELTVFNRGGHKAVSSLSLNVRPNSRLSNAARISCAAPSSLKSSQIRPQPSQVFQPRPGTFVGSATMYRFPPVAATFRNAVASRISTSIRVTSNLTAFKDLFTENLARNCSLRANSATPTSRRGSPASEICDGGGCR